MDVKRVALVLLGLMVGTAVFAQSNSTSLPGSVPIQSTTATPASTTQHSELLATRRLATSAQATSSTTPSVTYGAPYYYSAWTPKATGPGCTTGAPYQVIPKGPPEQTVAQAVTDFENSFIACFGSGCTWTVSNTSSSTSQIAAVVTDGGNCEGSDNIYATAHAPNVGDGDVGGDGEGDEHVDESSPDVGDPIDASTGNKYLKQDDYVDASAWLTFRRFYNSNEYAPIGSFGQDWRGSFDRSLFVGSSTVIMTRPDASQETFTKSNGVWTSESSSVDVLTETDNSDGVATAYSIFIGANHHTETYTTAGLLTSVTDQTGQGITLTYSTSSTPTTTASKAGLLLTVTDPKGRSLNFTYNGSSEVSKVTLPDGGTLTYTYDGDNWLTTVKYPDATTRQYLYNESSFVSANGFDAPYMTGSIDENGTRYSNTAYDANNRATITLLGGGQFSTFGGINHTQVAYNSDGTSTVTYPLGNTATFGFAQTPTGLNQVTSLNQTCGRNCDRHWKSQAFDTNGYPKTSIDFNSNTTTTQYDTFGELTAEIDASGTTSQRTINTTWDTTKRRPLTRSVLDNNGNAVSKTEWVYNSLAEVTAKCAIDPAKASTYTCATTGTVPAGVRRWTYTYCTSVGANCPLVGLLLTATGPRTDLTQTTQYAYYTTSSAVNCGTPGAACYQAGDLHTVTDAMGHVTTIASYDADGRVTRVTDPNGVNTDSTYTSRGWLASRTAGGSTTQFTYWPFGSVETITDPDGVVTTYSYDSAHRLDEIQDSLGNFIGYNLDGAGNITSEQTLTASRTTVRSLSRTFNTLGQLTAVKDGLGNTVFSASATNSYDANNNLIVSSDALGVQTQHAYDPLNRLISTIKNYEGTDTATQNTTTAFENDTLNRVIGISDPSELNTVYDFDAFGNQTALQSPDTGSSSDTYDAAGNPLTHMDAMGVVATSAYDALNRIISTTYTATTQNVSYAYDEANSVTGCSTSSPVGRLTRIIEKKVTTVYCYDAHGNVLQKKQVLGTQTDTTAYTYTSANRLKTIQNPDGTIVSYTYDTTGHISSIAVTPDGSSTAITVVSSVTWMPFGPVSSYTLGSGQTITRTYDANYRLTDLTSTALNLHFARDLMGNINAIGSASGASPATETYAYDPLYRLKEVSDSGKALETYTYNKTGDRLSKTSSGLATGTYGYKANTHWLTSIGTSTRAYDANGNMTGDSTSGQAYVFGYSARNRLVSVTLGGSTVGTYTYNALGQRIEKVAGSVTERYAYDESNDLVGEYGSDDRDYIWMGDIPVALVDVTINGSTASSVVNYVLADHLGTPRVVTNHAGTVLWSWAFQGNPFGEQQPTSSSGYTLNLRYPGQYYDAEKGNNYNYHRDYDPTTGRYLQSDALGMAGGSTTYGYVGLNPLNNADQLALAVNLNLFPPLSNIWRYAQMVPSAPGIYEVGAHGDPSSIQTPDEQGSYSAGQLASMIDSDMDYQQGETVFLGSCNTGDDTGSWDGSEPFAEQLADNLNAPVIAPTDYAWYSSDGDIFSANTEIPSPPVGATAQQLHSGPSTLIPGQWVTYLPTQILTQ
jgi:RHS repeat-associated protein